MTSPNPGAEPVNYQDAGRPAVTRKPQPPDFARSRLDSDRYYATPIRLISHSNTTPEFSLTRLRTVSPSVSMSLALAPPRLIRKLQCISETCASPTLKPRQPAASMSCQAL